MKIVIDIHEKDYQSILNSGQAPYGVVYAIMNGTSLPEDATNGDVIEAMFPDVEVKEKNNGYEIYFGVGTCIQFFNHQWWNAPYKEVGDADCD